MVINSLEPESCPVTSVAPPTESPTEMVTVIVTVCGIVILLVVTAIVVIVIAVVVCCRKQSKHRYVGMQHKHSQYVHDYTSNVTIIAAHVLIYCNVVD